MRDKAREPGGAAVFGVAIQEVLSADAVAENAEGVRGRIS